MKSWDTLNGEEYLDKVHAKLINHNCDEASVMSGSVSGVQRRMKESKSYGDSETAKKASGYADFIKTPKLIFYLTFLQDVLDKLWPLSLEFQKDELLVYHIPITIITITNKVSHRCPSQCTRVSSSSYVKWTESNDNNELIYKDLFLKNKWKEEHRKWGILSRKL